MSSQFYQRISRRFVIFLVFQAFIVTVISGTLFSCTRSSFQGDDPKRRLSEYIAKTFSIKQVTDKDFLLSYLTGDVKKRLQSWSDDQFQEAFIDSRRTFLKLLFKEVRIISATETEIVYELTFFDSGREKGLKKYPSQVMSKKLSRMVIENGKWMIAEVKSIKELIEFQDALSLP